MHLTLVCAHVHLCVNYYSKQKGFYVNSGLNYLILLFHGPFYKAQSLLGLSSQKPCVRYSPKEQLITPEAHSRFI